MANSKLGFICSNCGHPISGPAFRWKDGSPVCSCLFRILISRLAGRKAKQTLALEAERSRRRWFWLLLFLGAVIFLVLH